MRWGLAHCNKSSTPLSDSASFTANDQRRSKNAVFRRIGQLAKSAETKVGAKQEPNQPGSTPLQRFAGSLLAGALAGTICLAEPQHALANNVRVEDVENRMLQAGLLAANAGRFMEAERFFQIVLKDDQESASAWSNLGNVHLSLGRPEEAVSEFTKAISLAPEAPVPLLNRALAREALGVQAAASGSEDTARSLFVDALQDCNGATSRDPKEFAAWFNKGNIQVRLGQFHEALASYTKAADLAPGISGYRLREAELMFQEGQADKSDRLMRGVVRKNPNYAEAQAALAAVEWASGRGESAEEHFEVATRLDPRWSRMEYIQNATRWPPALYDAMRKFLAIAPGLT